MARRLREPEPSWISKYLKTSHLKEPPQGTLRKAVALRSQLGAPEASWSLVRLFDSMLEPLAPGVRGTGSNERRMLFRAESAEQAFEIDLSVKWDLGKKGRLTVAGQVLPPWTAATVRLESGPRSHRENVGEGGDFLFHSIPSSGKPLSLFLESPTHETLTIEDVPLPELD